MKNILYNNNLYMNKNYIA